MAFATRADLLARSNAQRLAQLAVPTDCEMVDSAALRIAIADGSLAAYSETDIATLNLALAAIDNALQDADALILSYGIPATVQTTLLARLASTIALYYLQGTERMTETLQNAYSDVIKQLKAHSEGRISLVPAVITDPPEVVSDEIAIFSSPSRYSSDSSRTVGWDNVEDF